MTEDYHFKWSSEQLCITCTWDQTHVLRVPRQVCYQQDHSGRGVEFETIIIEVRAR